LLNPTIYDLKNLNLKFKNPEVSSFIAPSLSKSFFKQAINILIISFALMSTVIFLYFREFVPSFAIVLSAIFDIIVTIGILDFLNIPISISGIGALLMLIGYSIDTDVLLTNRVIREKGDDYFEKTFFAFKTGVLMSATTLIAGIGALFLTNSEVIYEISLILVIGLIVDFISTWLQNTGILLWWINKKKN
jgi:preprotein translocase subunit SecF